MRSIFGLGPLLISNLKLLSFSSKTVSPCSLLQALSEGIKHSNGNICSAIFFMNGLFAVE